MVYGGGLSTSDFSASLRIVGLERQQPCTSVSWWSTSSLRCLSPSGYGSGLSAVLHVGGSEGTVTHAFSYDAPLVTAIEPPLLRTSGSAYVWVRGLNFGQLQDVELHCSPLPGTASSLSACLNLGRRDALVPSISIGMSLDT